MARPLTKANLPILVLALLPSGAAAFFVSRDFGSLFSVFLGSIFVHEEITRQSILDVQDLLTAQGVTNLGRFESQENLSSNPKLRRIFSGGAEFLPPFLSWIRLQPSRPISSIKGSTVEIRRTVNEIIG